MTRPDLHVFAHSGGGIIVRFLDDDDKERMAFCGKCNKPLTYLGCFIVGIAKEYEFYQCTSCEQKYELKHKLAKVPDNPRVEFVFR